MLSLALALLADVPMTSSFQPAPAARPEPRAGAIGSPRRLSYRVEVTFDEQGQATACRFIAYLPPTDPPTATPQQVCTLEMEIWAKHPREPGPAGPKRLNRYLPVAALTK